MYICMCVCVCIKYDELKQSLMPAFTHDMLTHAPTAAVALRIMEVRRAYVASDFEWDQLKKVSLEVLESETIAVMRQYASEKFVDTTE